MAKDTVLIQFGHSASKGQPAFVTPFVVTGAPPFDPNRPERVALYSQLIERAAGLARPAVSGDRIGALVVGGSGRIYLGGNVEIYGAEPNDNIHAESFAILLARQHGETSIQQLFLNKTMCGGCRQTLLDCGDTNTQVISTEALNKGLPNSITTIGQLLPQAYTSANGNRHLLLGTITQRYTPKPAQASSLLQAAAQAANQAFASKPGTWAGVGLQLRDGTMMTGSSVKISGNNPTIKPLEDALVALIASGKAFEAIEKAILVQPVNPAFRFDLATRRVLRAIAPQARLKVVRVSETA